MSSELSVLPDSKELAEQRGHVLGVQQAANAYEIKIVEDVVRGEAMLRDIRTVEIGMDERKTLITKPLMKSLSSIRDLFRPFELALTDAKKTVKSKILAYQIEQEEAARIEAERIERRVERGTMLATTAASKLEAAEATKIKTNTRTLVKMRVVDATVIPREYLTPDMTLITTAILREGKEIPGVEKYQEKVLVIK